MNDEDTRPQNIEPDPENYVFKKLDEDVPDAGISFKKIDPNEAYQPVDRITPIKEKLASSADKLKNHVHKAKEKLQATVSEVKDKVQSIPTKQKKLALTITVGLVIIFTVLKISISMYHDSDAYAYNLATNYVKAQQYEEAAEIYERLVAKKNDLNAKEILAFLYLDELQNPTLAEPLLREILDITTDKDLLAKLSDLFPIVTVSPDSINQETYKELITIELNTTATGANILYKLENNESYTDFHEYHTPIQLSDGENILYVKAISSVGFETDTLSYVYTINLDDKFVEFNNSPLEYEIKKKLNKANSEEKLRQSDLDKIESIQILGDDLLINMAPTDPTLYQQDEPTIFYGFEDYEKLKNLKELKIVNNDFEGKSYNIPPLQNLETLDVTYSKLADITFLRSFPNLLHLDFSHNEIESVNGIQNLEKLETLNLKNNHISDVYHLSNLPGLTSLDISNNPVQDTTVLKTLTNLVNLAFTSTSLTDYKFMAQMTQLKSLDAGNYSRNKQYLGSDGRDISSLQNLGQLEVVSLEGAGIKNIDPLKGLQNITKLNLSYNELVQGDIETIGTLNNLQHLNIENTSYNVNMMPLAGLSKITHLNLNNNGGIGSLEFLGNMKALNILSAQRIGLQSLDELATLNNIEYLDISNNNLIAADLSGYNSLIYFDATSNQLKEYPKTSSQTAPEVMILKNNPIEELSPLGSAITDITYLDLSGTRIQDISIFSKATKLKTLKLPPAGQLLNTSVFDDMHPMTIVPINTSENDLPTDLLDEYLTKFIMN